MSKGTNTTALVPFELPAMPAEVAAFFDAEANVKPRQTVPSLSPGGRKWTLSLNGEDTVLQRKDPKTGDVSPVQIMRVVVLDWNQQRGRAYYAGGYDPEKPGVPVCWSDNGVKPHDKVEAKQHPTCDGCPMAAKNSKVSENGKGVRACSEHRMLALVPATKLDFEPLRMKISITSDWDAKSPQHEAAGWYAWSNYMDVLRARMPQQTHTARVVTKMKFDDAVDYPKILFGFDRPTTAEELVGLMTKIQNEKPKIKALITGTFTPNGRDGVRADDDDTGGETANVGGLDTSQPKPQTAPKTEAAKAPTELTPAQKALAAAKAALAKAEAEAAAPVETPKQKALREAKEALASAEAEAAGDTGEDAGEGSGEDGEDAGGDGDINIPTGATQAPTQTAQAVNGVAAGGTKATGKAATGKAAGAGKKTDAPAVSAPPAGDPLGNLLTEWDT